MAFENSTLGSIFQVTHTEFDPLNTNGVRDFHKTVRNTSFAPALLTDPVFISLMLPVSFSNLIYCASGWGQECTPKYASLGEAFSFQNTRGRSSGESSPFFTVYSPDLSIDFAICTSANYRVDFIPCPDGLQIRIAEPDPSFSVNLAPGECFTYPSILIHSYTTQKQCYREKHQYQQTHMLHNDFLVEQPVIYNHWWAYNDLYIDEATILENARIAREIGAEMLVLDSGWYGKDALSEDSFHSRGDWSQENRARFPHGISWLKEQIEGLGLKFGIWCEIETVGDESNLITCHPEFLAQRDGKPLEYLCFGNESVQQWAYETMHSMLTQYGSTYWKLDFNLDPGYGCNCTHHSHGSGDGLYRHYAGLYRVMDRLREDFPDLVIENCSSGGQRLNLEIGKHTHIHFLSDPDYSTHQMRIFKNISRWLMPKQMLHFMWSNTSIRISGAPFPSLDLDTLTPAELCYHMRLAMMHPFGISHPLQDYSPRTLNLMKQQLQLYKALIRPYIAHGEFLPVYLSEHTNFFSFTKDDRILIFGFAEEPDQITLDLSDVLSDIPHTEWTLTDLDTQELFQIKKENGYRHHFTATQSWNHCLLLLQPHIAC